MNNLACSTPFDKDQSACCAPAPEKASACCGGPPKSRADACCARDEAAKEEGKSGCGCGSAAKPARAVTQASCC